MFPIYRNLIRAVFSSVDLVLKPKDTNTLIDSIVKMTDKFPFKKQKYDGRSKKRQWEERRTDKGEAFKNDLKKPKVEEVSAETVLDKIKRRKYCILMGYSGVNYYGMQRNPYSKTIEEELFKALHKLEYINDDCFSQVQNMQFQRAARTDKGVSAARQIVSLKLPENIDVEKINSVLPEDVRVFGFKRVTKGFNSKSQCDSRTYTYMLPTVAFANQHEKVTQSEYRLSDEKFTEINDMLKNYIGTKNYHNFTSKKKPNDPSAKRYMKTFECGKPFVRKNVEFVVLKVQGQSFMLHQIRKMVGLTLAVSRGLASIDIFQKCFTTEKVTIPRAPGLGLVLEYVHYDRYNFRYSETHEKLLWDEVEDVVEDFKEKFIYPIIVDTEIEEESMLDWIHRKLSRHSYDATENESDDEGGADDDDEDGKKTDDINEKKEVNIVDEAKELTNKVENVG